MLLLIPYLISISIGYLVIKTLYNKSCILYSWLHCVLSVGVGLGLSGLITFISILILGQLNNPLLITFHLLLLATLIYLNKDIFPIIKTHWQNQKPHILRNILICLFWIASYYGLSTFATKYPFGGWDAWALWNTKTKFLAFAGNNWTDIVNILNSHTQPDYPLLLPSINTWIHSFGFKELSTITFTTAIVLSSSTIMLVFTSLKHTINTRIAWLISILMGSNYCYILFSTSQYADVLLSFFILASFICLHIFLENPKIRSTFLLGIFLGLMSFTKNEGIVISLLILSIVCIYLLLKKSQLSQFSFQWIGALLISYLCTAFVTIYFKIFLAPSNPDILLTKNVSYEYFNFKGLSIILKHTLNEFFHFPWGYLWIVLSIMFLIKLPKYFQAKSLIISLFIIAYTIILLLVYLSTVNFDLSWRLESTANRILFYLLPTIIFLNFYTHYHKE